MVSLPKKGYPLIVKEDLLSIKNNIVISYAYYEANLLCVTFIYT